MFGPLQKCLPGWRIGAGIFLGLTYFLLSHAALMPNFERMLFLAQQRYGPDGHQAVQDWQTLLVESRLESRERQLEQINNFINHRVFSSDDLLIWGQQDYWATPLEALGRGAGDCEDSALAKYFSLLRLGVADQQLRLIYVRAQFNGTARAHMVLGYYPTPEQEPLILDSLRGDILPAAKRRDLLPIYSFNASALWVGGNPAVVASPAARLSNWRSVLERMHQEGWR